MENTVPDDIRFAVIKDILMPKTPVSVENKAIVESNDKVDKSEDFMSLFEKVVENKTKQNESQTKAINETKDRVIKNLRMDILDDMRL